jgi:hypothetical protein
MSGKKNRKEMLRDIYSFQLNVTSTHGEMAEFLRKQARVAAGKRNLHIPSH